VWPGRRYWRWNLRIWIVLAVGFVVVDIVLEGPSGDIFALAEWTELWVMLSVTLWLILLAGGAIVRTVRHFANPS
jgi:hypothetical protein